MINSVPRKSRELSKEIQSQIEAFISQGGEIKVCGSEANSKKAVELRDFTINASKSHLRSSDIKPPTDPKTVK